MSTNISKEKREILINKIKQIKQFIEKSPQDENTINLLSYIADIEKDIKGKKYSSAWVIQEWNNWWNTENSYSCINWRNRFVYW